ncbi:MAG: ABC transporter permease subunit, partial [Acutalibacteraceae bacterium]|nr:ABC transporter permease subunit [Acutalibacteraceae bacterium]
MSFQQVTLDLAVGFLENCRLFFETLLFSIPLGLIISFCSMSKFKPLSYLMKIFVWCIRGTPLMLQLFVVLYVPGLVFNMPMRNRMLAAL